MRVEGDREPPSQDGDGTCELVRRAQEGDRQALNELVDRYYPRLLQLVRVRLGRRLRGYLESVDILQETFRDAVRELDRFEMRDDAALLHWLGRIAENRIRAQIDHLQAEKRPDERMVPLQPVHDSGALDGHDHDPADSAALPLQQLLVCEDIGRIEDCLDELREDYREVILHRYVEGADWRSIAEWMGLSSPDAARMCSMRALVALESLYRARGGGSSDASG